MEVVRKLLRAETASGVLVWLIKTSKEEERRGEQYRRKQEEKSLTGLSCSSRGWQADLIGLWGRLKLV